MIPIQINKRKGVSALSAKILHSIPDDLHKRLKKIAKDKKTSVTALINNVMGDYAGIYTDPGFIDEFRKRIESLEKSVKEMQEKIK